MHRQPSALTHQASHIPTALQTVTGKYLLSFVYKGFLLQRTFFLTHPPSLPRSPLTNLLLLPAVNPSWGFKPAESSNTRAAPQKSPGLLHLGNSYEYYKLTMLCGAREITHYIMLWKQQILLSSSTSDLYLHTKISCKKSSHNCKRTTSLPKFRCSGCNGSSKFPAWHSFPAQKRVF